jgi:DNA-binding MarR family transcriptional regulator
VSTPQRKKSPTRQQLIDWRSFLECSYALIDILDADLQRETGLTLRWYDILIHLEEDDGCKMSELAERIIFSRSGLTSLIDRMEKEGLVRRERQQDDRRVIRLFLTPDGSARLRAARASHHESIQRHYLDHLTAHDLTAMMGPLTKLENHLREILPGRISRQP